jgi:hypothetical protein
VNAGRGASDDGDGGLHAASRSALVRHRAYRGREWSVEIIDIESPDV